FGKLNELVRHWFSQAQVKNIPLLGPIIQEKATAFTAELGLNDFKASNGWLDCWKSHEVKAFKISGKSVDVDIEVVDDFKEHLLDIVQGYAPSNIFNCDETGLFFCLLPDKILSTKGEACKGTKLAKERVTYACLACSAKDEKLKTLVIGKSQEPQYFKNGKAWMTGKLFAHKQMCLQKRHILMFLDNPTFHAEAMQLSHVTLKFLPANTTGKLQPQDQRIICAFKARYRKCMI
uniref:HTH CENPB-type domain-containing protein n=1 Tax=Latimeria chalumnae TaxID=7897 RepID=H3B248_LATCH